MSDLTNAAGGANAEDAAYAKGRFLRGLRVQMRVIGALILRELHTRYGRENVGLIWLFLEPMLLGTMVALIHSHSGTHYGSDIKPIPLSMIGYCNFITFRQMFSRAEGALEANVALLYHRTISIFDILLSRGVLEAVGTWIAFFLLMGFVVALGMANLPARPLFLLLGMFLLAWLSFSLSMIVCAVTHDNRSIGRLVHPLTYIMMPLSGAFFPLHSIPTGVREFFLAIPFAHIFEILRYGWFKSARTEYIDPLYLGEWLLLSTLFGLLLLSILRQRIHMG